jgi:hypothetical protein
VLLLSKLVVTDNIMAIANEVRGSFFSFPLPSVFFLLVQVLDSWSCFSGLGSAEHSAVRIVMMQARLRDNNLQAALLIWKEFAQIDSLGALLFSHVLAAAKRGDEKPAKTMIDFAADNKLEIPRIESLRVHMKRAANIAQQKT